MMIVLPIIIAPVKKNKFINSDDEDEKPYLEYIHSVGWVGVEKLSSPCWVAPGIGLSTTSLQLILCPAYMY